MYLGVDGCPSGWLVVALSDDKTCRVMVEPDIGTITRRYPQAQLILIDTIIGLKESGTEERRCDKEARKLLGERRSSVFPAPCRQAVYMAVYEEASQVNDQITGRKLSRQSWAICDKIREVDQYLAETPSHGLIREMHPEVVFWALNGGQPMAESKHTEAGGEERIALLERYFPQAGDVLQEALDYYLWRDAERADIVDALAGAITAYMGRDRLATLPETPEVDPRGLPMEMVYLPLALTQ